MIEKTLDGRQERLLACRPERRSSVRARKSPAPKTTAENVWTSSAASDERPASRTSRAAPLGRCTPCRLAGSVAASFATRRSPGCRKSTNRDRGACVMCPAALTTSSLASRGRWTGRSAAIIGVSRQPLWRPATLGNRSRVVPPPPKGWARLRDACLAYEDCQAEPLQWRHRVRARRFPAA